MSTEDSKSAHIDSKSRISSPVTARCQCASGAPVGDRDTGHRRLVLQEADTPVVPEIPGVRSAIPTIGEVGRQVLNPALAFLCTGLGETRGAMYADRQEDVLVERQLAFVGTDRARATEPIQKRLLECIQVVSHERMNIHARPVHTSVLPCG